MIGSYISGDFYFHFDTIDIQTLEKTGKTQGTFAANSNKVHGQKIKMLLRVKVVTGNVMSDIDIDYDNKVAELTLEHSDFENWLFDPTEWVLHNGPACRFASCNVYISQEQSSKQWKSEIDIFLRT
jgi:hypothetical protein